MANSDLSFSVCTDELVALNEKFMKARTSYDKMLENSIARYSSPPVGKSNLQLTRAALNNHINVHSL